MHPRLEADYRALPRKRGLRYGAGRHYLGSHGFITYADLNLPRVSVHIGYTRVFVYVIYVLLLLRIKTLDGVDILLA